MITRATEDLSVEVIRPGLRTNTVGRQLFLFAEVESTNTLLRNLAQVGAREGTVVLAEAQTRGRGRRGQQWFSPAGVNLYASVLFRPAIPAKEAGVFSLAASLALTDAIKELGLGPAIKWPNDVLVDRKKVAGTLTGCATRGAEVEYVILGVGVNVNVELDELRVALGSAGLAATSLRAACGHEIDRNAFAISYLNRLDTWARRYREEGREPILAAWRERDILTGRRVEVRGDGGAFDGRVLGVNEDGRLVVRDSVAARVISDEEIRVLD